MTDTTKQSTRKSLKVSKTPLIGNNKVIHLRGNNNYGGVTIAYAPDTRTIVDIAGGGIAIKVAIAICGVNDNYDRSHGRKIAQARLDTSVLTLIIDEDKAINVVNGLVAELNRQYKDDENSIIRQFIRSVDKSIMDYYEETALTEAIEKLVMMDHKDLYLKK